MLATDKFECTVCGDSHDLIFSLGYALPDFASKVPVWEKSERLQSTEDWCIVDQRHYYIRACLELPIEDADESFVLGVWCAISENDFYRIMDIWDAPDKDAEPPYAVTIANEIPFYPKSLGLPARLKNRPSGQRPLVFVKSSDNVVYAHQHEGLPRARLVEFTQLMQHKGPESGTGCSG